MSITAAITKTDPERAAKIVVALTENVVFFVAVGHYAGWWGVATAWSLYGIVARLVERAKR